MLSIKLPFTNESTYTFMAKSLSLRSCMCVSYPLANVPKNNVHILLVELICLVVSTPLKNMKVSWAYYSQYMET